jgi:cellulose synthase (UDP-forming)
MVRSAIVGLAKPVGHKFQVTAKGGDRSSKSVQWSMLAVFVGYITITAVSILWAYFLDASRPLADASAMALFWSWYNLIILTLACFVAVEEGQRRSAERFHAEMTFELRTPGQALRFRMFDISVTGIALFGECPVPLDSPVTVTVGNLPVPGVIVRASSNSFAVHFLHTEETRGHLIRHLFSGRYRNAVDQVQVGEVTLGIVSRLWR